MVMGRSTSSSPRTDGERGSKSRRGVKLKKRVGEEGPGRSVMRDAQNKEWQQQQQKKKHKDEEEEARLQEPTTTEQTRATSSEGEQRMRRKDGAADKREITKESQKEEGRG